MNRALCMNYFIIQTQKQLITAQRATGTFPTLLILPICQHVSTQNVSKIRTVRDTVILARNNLLPDDDIVMSKHVGLF